MSRNLAGALEAVGFGVAAGMTAAALMYAATGQDWIGSAIAAFIGLLIGLAGLAWSNRWWRHCGGQLRYPLAYPVPAEADVLDPS